MEISVKERIMDFIRYKKISVRAFEKTCGLSNGYVRGIEKTIMPAKIKTISLMYPELNVGWLLTGEGEMLKSNISQTSQGDNFTNIAGHGNNVNNSSTLDKAIDEISEQRKLVAKSQEQIDRLLTIIEKMKNV